jgi:hypothetical protein
VTLVHIDVQSSQKLSLIGQESENVRGIEDYKKLQPLCADVVTKVMK